MIQKRKLFPCFFGSALKLQGVKELLDSFCRLSKLPCYSEDFGARIYKISRDSQGNRLSHLKVTGGILKVKTAPVSGCPDKINQIRIYLAAGLRRCRKHQRDRLRGIRSFFELCRAGAGI